MVTSVIADDEPLSLRRLEQALRDFPDIEIVGKANNGSEALKIIRQHDPQLLLLDIQMPGLNGIELVETLQQAKSLPVIIFISAFNSFAVDAFGVEAIDYLLKPLDDERLGRALGRARSALAKSGLQRPEGSLPQFIDALKAENAANDHVSYLWVNVRNRIIRIRTDDVACFEAAGDYVVAQTQNRNYLMPDSIRALEARLDPNYFVRVHRGRIINRREVVEVLKCKFGRLELRLGNGTVVPIGRHFRDRLPAVLCESA